MDRIFVGGLEKCGPGTLGRLQHYLDGAFHRPVVKLNAGVTLMPL